MFQKIFFACYVKFYEKWIKYFQKKVKSCLEAFFFKKLQGFKFYLEICKTSKLDLIYL